MTLLTTLDGAERLSDAELMDVAGLRAAPFRDEIWFVTHAGERRGVGAFVVSPHDLAEFAAEHRRQLGERLFSGLDLVAVDRARTTLWLYHHGGGFAVIRRPGSHALAPTLASPWTLTLRSWFVSDTSRVERIAVDATGTIRLDHGDLHLGSWHLDPEETARLGGLLGAPAIAALGNAPPPARGRCHRVELRAPDVDVDATLAVLPLAMRDVQVALGQAIRARLEADGPGSGASLGDTAP